MKKSILAVLLLTVICMVSLPVSAETVDSYLAGLNKPPYELPLQTELLVKKAGDSTYSGSSLSIEKSSSASWPTFDYQATLRMQSVRDAFTQYLRSVRLSLTLAGKESLLSGVSDLKVRGTFGVAITYPSTLIVPDAFLESGQMAGFSDNAKTIFKDTSRNVVTEGGNTTLTIQVAVKSVDGTQDYVTAGVLEENLATYLADVTLTAAGVSASDYATFPVVATVTGNISIGEDDAITMQCTSAEKSASVTIRKKRTESTPTVLPGTPSDGGNKNVSVTPSAGGNVMTLAPSGTSQTAKVDVSKLETPKKEGASFDGWYLDAARTIKAEGVIEVTAETPLYVKWINTEVPAPLKGKEHINYIQGYPDNTIKPENQITREEAAMIFYRLLREINADATNSAFVDVHSDRWSAEAIRVMAAEGYITGYPNEEFIPAAGITRAEIVTILSRFSDNLQAEGASFSDTKGHWAEKAIAHAINCGYVTGYEDGSFRPDAFITRAEAMVILNRVLVRTVNKDATVTTNWVDNDKDAWYYYDVVAATSTKDIA